MKYLNDDLFSGIAVAAPPTIAKFCLNFNKNLNPYIKRKLLNMRLFVSLTSAGEQLMASLTTASYADSFRVTPKKTGAGSSFFSPVILDLAGFIDTEQYRMIVVDDLGSEVLFNITSADSLVITGDPLITVHAPTLSKRTDSIALRKLQAKASAPEFLKFCNDVETVTDQQEKSHGSLFGNAHLARRPGMTRDHVHSKKESFLLGIPAEVAGHYTNINWLTGPENSSKGSRCDKTAVELLDDYFFAVGMKGSQITAYCKKHGLLFYIQ